MESTKFGLSVTAFAISFTLGNLTKGKKEFIIHSKLLEIKDEVKP